MKGLMFKIKYTNMQCTHEYFRDIIYNNAYKLLDHPLISDDNDAIKCEAYSQLARIYFVHYNIPVGFKYTKLAYELCLRSSNHTRLPHYKAAYMDYRVEYAKLPPLRFAVGDEVEFLHELETGSEWKRGKVVELHYRERVFELSVSIPYRLQLLEECADSTDQPPVYASVKADLDRYVRKASGRSRTLAIRLDWMPRSQSCLMFIAPRSSYRTYTAR